MIRLVGTANLVPSGRLGRRCECGVSIEHRRGNARWCENCATARRRRQKAVWARRWRDSKHLCGMPPADWYVENPDLSDMWVCGTPDPGVCDLCGEEGLVALWRFPAFYAAVCSPIRPESHPWPFSFSRYNPAALNGWG